MSYECSKSHQNLCSLYTWKITSCFNPLLNEVFGTRDYSGDTGVGRRESHRKVAEKHRTNLHRRPQRRCKVVHIQTSTQSPNPHQGSRRDSDLPPNLFGRKTWSSVFLWATTVSEFGEDESTRVFWREPAPRVRRCRAARGQTHQVSCFFCASLLFSDRGGSGFFFYLLFFFLPLRAEI